MGRKPKDYRDRQFGLLRALEIIRLDKDNEEVYWLCECECGKIVTRSSRTLSRGTIISCGCKRNNTRYYLSPKLSAEVETWDTNLFTKLRRTFTQILSRCRYEGDYKTLGIQISKEWEESFETFILDMGLPPTLNHSIDRIDNNKGYSKENCRWADIITQRNNQARMKTYVYEDREVTLSELSKETGIPLNTLWDRVVKKGWSIENSLGRYYTRSSEKTKEKIYSGNIAPEKIGGR